MTQRHAATVGALGLLLACGGVGCTSYETALTEFDSVARWHETKDEPAAVDYRETPDRWPWTVRQVEGSGFDVLLVELLGIEPGPSAVPNPSGFARERLTMAADMAVGDLHRTAAVAARLLWVAELDDHPLNQVIAFHCIETLMPGLDIDLLEGSRRPLEEQGKDRLQAWVNTIRAAWPPDRSGTLPTERRAAYLETLLACTDRALPSPRDQRTLILLLSSALELETDAELAAATRAALLRALRHGFVQSLTRAIERSETRTVQPVVREVAIHTLRVTGGPYAVAFVLAAIHRRSVAIETVNSYDDDPFVRLELIRMCGQLGAKLALENPYGGPLPVEFLYDTLMSKHEEEGLRVAALEALAFTLQHPISFERSWAEEWWRRFALERRS